MSVLRPADEAELAALLREATAPLSVKGGGTRLLPGEGQGQALCTAAMTGVTLYEPEALTLVVRAGTPLETVRTTLAAEGQHLAFEPQGLPGSTIGGVVAANASGPRRVQAGACRDALIGVRFVTGSGQVVKNGGRVMKNVTGYDLVKLMAGSRGRLGVLTEVAFKTAPLPPARMTLSLPRLSAAEAIPALTAALGGPWDMTGAGWLPGYGAVIRLEGLKASVEIRAETLKRRLTMFGPVEEIPFDWLLLCKNILGGNPAKPDGGAKLPLATAAPQSDLWRILCRPSEAPTLLNSLPGAVTLDWGGALIWAELPPGEAPNLPAFSGHATRIRGATPATLPEPDPITAGLDAGLRAQFDPPGLLGS